MTDSDAAKRLMTYAMLGSNIPTGEPRGDDNCAHDTFIEHELGWRLCVNCDREWWEDPL